MNTRKKTPKAISEQLKTYYELSYTKGQTTKRKGV